MSTWTSPAECRPEFELLVRRWQLPRERVGDLETLLRSHDDGATAIRLNGKESAFGPAALDLRRAAAPGITSGVSVAPLVLLEHDGETYLQSWRYYAAEQTIARELLRRADVPSRGDERERVAADPSDSQPSALNSQLFSLLNTEQRRAVQCALAHRLALITGGPGTGKTHTIARLLAVQLRNGADPASIQLAAPTGKAADRMKEAVEAAADRLPDDMGADVKSALKRIAGSACTLHRLLGANPANGRCQFNVGHRLPCQILIVDECSMVDTLLWQALLVALRPETQLVLVGDPNQLESVHAGDVLGSVVRFARTHPMLGNVWVELTESQRFKSRPGIGALAEAIVNQRADAAIDLLRKSDVGRGLRTPPALAPSDSQPASDLRNPSIASPLTPSLSQSLTPGGLVFLGDNEGRFEFDALPAAVREAVEAVAFAPTPDAGLSALERVRFLTAHRDHSHDAAGLNAGITRHLEHLAKSRFDSAFAVGCSLLDVGRSADVQPAVPIIINRNDAETGLSNGSVGVVMTVSGVRAAYFPANAADAAPRRIGLSQLPEHSPAWAMTIHRSQGSEFDHVVVYLPRDDSPLATRELLYTAITRAKHNVYLSGTESTLRSALNTRATRCTLLQPALVSASRCEPVVS